MHNMFIKLKGESEWLSDEDIRELSYDATDAFGHWRFGVVNYPGEYQCQAIERVPFMSSQDANEWAAGEFEPPDLSWGVVVWEDYRPIVAPSDEQWIEVRAGDLYYGEGEERGDVAFTLTLARWLERRVPRGKVHYGRNARCLKGEPFDAAAQAALFDHFVVHGHKPYRAKRREEGNREIARHVRHERRSREGREVYTEVESIPDPHCEFCGDKPLDFVEADRGTSLWECGGCSLRVVVDALSGDPPCGLSLGSIWGDSVASVEDYREVLVALDGQTEFAYVARPRYSGGEVKVYPDLESLVLCQRGDKVFAGPDGFEISLVQRDGTEREMGDTSQSVAAWAKFTKGAGSDDCRCLSGGRDETPFAFLVRSLGNREDARVYPDLEHLVIECGRGQVLGKADRCGVLEVRSNGEELEVPRDRYSVATSVSRGEAEAAVLRCRPVMRSPGAGGLVSTLRSLVKVFRSGPPPSLEDQVEAYLANGSWRWKTAQEMAEDEAGGQYGVSVEKGA